MTQSPLTHAVVEVLRQGESLLRRIDEAKYFQRAPAAFNSTVGGHFRHCLDHFQSLLDGLDADAINYDHRARDPRVENDRNVALRKTQQLLAAFQSIPPAFLDCPVNVESQLNYTSGPPLVISSTVGRELMDAVAHTIHHYALIAIICGMLDVAVPDGFGIAPSTLRYHAEQRKAA